MSETLVSLRGVTKSYTRGKETVQVLEALDLEIAAGDFNLDGCVDGEDLGLFLLMFGVVDPEYGDLNGDGVVDGADYGLMLILMQADCS